LLVRRLVLLSGRCGIEPLPSKAKLQAAQID
jgi:hypothetical protein